MHGFLFLARSYGLMFSKFLHDSADFPRKENLPNCHDTENPVAIS